MKNSKIQKHAEIKRNTLKQLVTQVRNQDENLKISVNISKAHKRVSGTRQRVCLSLLAQKHCYKLSDLFKVMY